MFVYIQSVGTGFFLFISSIVHVCGFSRLERKKKEKKTGIECCVVLKNVRDCPKRNLSLLFTRKILNQHKNIHSVYCLFLLQKKKDNNRQSSEGHFCWPSSSLNVSFVSQHTDVVNKRSFKYIILSHIQVFIEHLGLLLYIREFERI